MEARKNIYHRASLPALILSIATEGATMGFYLLIGFASYAATQNFGIGTVLAGTLLMVSRIFDGVVDPFIAALFDRWIPGKHGKIRIFSLAGLTVMSLADILLFVVFAGRVQGVAAAVVFVLMNVLHATGYSMVGIGSSVIQTAITNDPVQRPFVNFIKVLYSYVVPMSVSTLISFVILPRHDNKYNMECLGEICIWVVILGYIFMALACIGVRKLDNPQTLKGIKAEGEEQKIGLKDMWSLLKNNKPLRMYILTGASDKLAQQVSSQSIIATMMGGVLIANFRASTMIGNMSSIVGMIFAFLGGVYIAKFGAKKATTVWSWVSILLNVVMIVFCLILGPGGMKQIGALGVPMLIYVVIMISTTGTRMILTTSAGTMRSDVIDYELSRSGNYMPGFVGAVYSFIDNTVSSTAAVIAGFGAAMVGYTSTVPQMGDEATWPILLMTLALMFGLPIVGWLCNIFAMRGYELSRERMVEVQTQIAEAKERSGQNK